MGPALETSALSTLKETNYDISPKFRLENTFILCNSDFPAIDRRQPSWVLRLFRNWLGHEGSVSIKFHWIIVILNNPGFSCWGLIRFWMTDTVTLWVKPNLTNDHLDLSRLSNSWVSSGKWKARGHLISFIWACLKSWTNIWIRALSKVEDQGSNDRCILCLIFRVVSILLPNKDIVTNIARIGNAVQCHS